MVHTGKDRSYSFYTYPHISQDTNVCFCKVNHYAGSAAPGRARRRGEEARANYPEPMAAVAVGSVRGRGS